MLDYSSDGYHYFPESKAPLKMKSKECEFHGFQPHVPLKKKKKKKNQNLKMVFKTFVTRL